MKAKSPATSGRKRGTTKITKTGNRTPRRQAYASIPTNDLLERINDGIVAFDAAMNYTYVNKRGGELLGRNPKDLIGKNYWVEYPEAKGTPFANAYVRALKTQKPIVLEDYYAPFDRWFENRIYPSKDGLTIFFTEITERKKEEQALLERERLISAITETTPALIYVYDMETRSNVYSNAGIENVLGYTPEEVQAMGDQVFARLIHPDDLPTVIEFQSQVMSIHTGETLEIEYRMQDAGGGWHHLHSYERAFLRKPDGTLKQKIGVAIDVTERKQAEEARRKSEETFAMIFKKAPFAAGLTNIPDGTYLQANEEFERVFGFSREEIIGKTSLELGMYPDPEARARSAALFREQGFVHNLDMRLQTRTGEIHDVLINSDLVEIGGEKYILTTANDITERKRAEEEVRAHRQLLETVVNYIPAAVSLLRGSDLRVQLINPAYQAIAPGKEMIGKTWDELWQETGQNFTAICQRVLETGEPHHVVDELNMIRRSPDGPVEPAYFSWSLHRVQMPGNDGWGLLGTAWETTSRKLAEDEVRLHRDRLADLSRRLVEVHESESRAIGRELHDQIGQMLTALKLTLEVAPQLPPELEAKKLAGAQELLDELMTRVSTLSLELRPPMLDDLGLLPALLWHINRYQEQTGIKVEFTHSGVEHRRFDFEVETTVYRVVQESLTNVARHAGAARVRLEVRVEAHVMIVQIEDDGAGFDPQAALAKNRGLSGMRERVRLLGGSFEIESQPGKGAKKFVQIPLKEKTT